MPRVRLLLVAALILLFFGLSFNAYACLLAIPGVTTTAMGNGCSTPEEPPVRQFCDAFTTISVQSAIGLDPSPDCQSLSAEDIASLSPLLIVGSLSDGRADHSPNRPAQDLLLKVCVLRI
jgi:hypothetical protein